MKRVCMFVVASVLLTGAGLAYPAFGGGRGMFRIQDALVEDEAGLTISFHAIGRNPKFPTTGDKAWVVDLIAPELAYAPIATKYVGLELFGSWGGVFQYPIKPGEEKKFDMGLSDLKAGGKISIPVVPVFKLGFSGDFTFRKKELTRGWLDPFALPQATNPDYTWTGLATLHFQDIAPSAPNLLFNYGKVNPGKENELTTYGAGVELAATGFALFAGARSLQPEGSDGIFDTDSGEIRMTPAVAFGTGTSGMTFKAGYTFAWGPSAANEAVFGLVIATPFGRRIPPEFGTVAGSVVDERTRQALAADVNFPENPELRSLKTDPKTGVFTVERVPAGVIVVEVVAEGYHLQAVPINVEGRGVSQYQFALRPLVTYGVIAGLVTDASTNKPLTATIEFPDTDVGALTSDAAGAFRADNIPVGVYTVTASADGYFKSSLTVQVEEGRVASPTFALKPLAMKSTLTGKVSDKKTGGPLAATVSFPNTDVPEVKTDAGTGVYMAEIPVGSYAVKVASEGYIAQTAAIVLQEDKPVIKDFALVKTGMAITLRGIYFDFNKATIRPESHAALADAANILKENPAIKVEIQGHTDAVGSDAYNQQLSERRARSVVTYLIQNFGIARGRLTAKGYGESQPVSSNDTEEGRQLNRRVEFVIVSEGE